MREEGKAEREEGRRFRRKAKNVTLVMRITMIMNIMTVQFDAFRATIQTTKQL